jgi:ATP-dependent DNA helicase RecG
MNDLHQELANGESEGIEFKRSTSLLKEAIQTLCAFANHKGAFFTLVLQMMGRSLGKQSRTTH